MFATSQGRIKLIGSVLLTIGGVIGILHPGAIPLLIVAILGTVLMLSGALRLGLYMSGSVKPPFADILISLLDIVGAFFVFANGQATTTFLCILIGMYVIVQGVIGIVINMHVNGTRKWWLGYLFQVLVIALGLLIMLHPTAASMGVGVLLGSFLFVKGIGGIWGCVAREKLEK